MSDEAESPSAPAQDETASRGDAQTEDPDADAEAADRETTGGETGGEATGDETGRETSAAESGAPTDAPTTHPEATADPAAPEQDASGSSTVDAAAAQTPATQPSGRQAAPRESTAETSSRERAALAGEPGGTAGPGLRAVARGAAGFLVSVTFTVVAVVASLLPPVPLFGAPVNVAAWSGLVILGLVAATWLGFEVGLGLLSLRRLATFVGTAWLLLLPLALLVEGVLVPRLFPGVVAIYLGRLLVFAVATAGAFWLAARGGWARVRGRFGSGGKGST